MLRSAWSSDQFSRGSTSFLAVGSSQRHREDLRQPVLDRVFFAGEATADADAGTVRGARASGTRAANEIAKVMGAGDKVAIVGAGAAGAEAARSLAALGVEVVVIEARDRTGGRIHSVPAEEGTAATELGAWLLDDAADSGVIVALDRLGIATSPIEEGTLIRAASVASAEEPTTPYPIGPDAVGSAVAWAADQPSDVSLADALDESGARESAADTTVDELPGAELLDGYLRSLAVVSGAEASALSAWYAPPLDGGPRLAVTGTFSTLVDDALGDTQLFLSTVVLGVSYSDEGVSLRLGGGESLTVDRVLLTVPLGVLKNNDIEFEPVLPFGHRAAISALGMGSAETVWLTFDEPFWATEATNWSLIGTDDAITTWVNLEPVTGKPVLVGLVGGDVAAELAELDDDELLDRVLDGLRPFASG